MIAKEKVLKHKFDTCWFLIDQKSRCFKQKLDVFRDTF